MSFKKPFHASPVELGPYYRARQRHSGRIYAAQILGISAIAGLVVGIVASLPGNGLLPEATRRHAPPAGAYYSGCNDARAAGVTPIRAGEPGYRPEMDGDGDGLACEPIRGLR